MTYLLAQELREAVLSAAIQGKLTIQYNTDTPVSNTLEYINSDKAAILTRKGMKDRNTFPPIADDEAVFEIPANWTWVRMSDIGVYKKGPFGSALTKSIFVPKSDESIKVYEQKNAIQKDWKLGEYYISKQYYEKSMMGFTVEPGDIIVSCAGTIGETYTMPNDIEVGIINQALMRMTISDHINNDYFLIVFNTVLKAESQRNSAGSAIKNIPPFDVFKAMLFPLPPIEEQARIVSRVEKLMAKIDEYEKFEKELAELKQRFPEEMKAAILQAAMQGKLTEQDDTDESAFSLVSSILEERKQLAKTKSIKAIKTYSRESLDDMEVPDNWAKAHLGDISTYQESKRKIKYTEAEKDTWSLDLEDIEKGGRLLAKVRVGDRKSSGDKTLFKEGDILYSKLRPYLLKILVAPDGGICTSELVPFKVYGGINPTFVVQYLKSPFVDNYINSVTYGVKMPRVNTETMENLAVPIPPLEEQQRIVDKLDALLPLCDELAELA